MIEWWRLLLIIILVILSGLFSGLNLGLMGLSNNNLEILMTPPFETDEAKRVAKYASKIMPLRKKGNLLLCNLLLGNVAVNSLLSILMADMTSGTVGFLASTALIVVFGEIMPQALCSRHGLAVGAKTIYLVYLITILLYPLAKPVSLILDRILGDEIGNFYNKSQMKNLLMMYEKEKMLAPEEAKLMRAALDFENKMAKDIMTPLNQIYMLDINLRLDEQLLNQIYDKGFSRIPVYETSPKNIIGILLVKDLILLNPKDKVLRIRQLMNIFVREVIGIDEDTYIKEILKEFTQTRSQIGIVRTVVCSDDRDPYYENVGILTLEDIIEEIIQDEIIDEHDNEPDPMMKSTKVLKQKVIGLFTDKIANKVLNDVEINAICSYCTQYVKPLSTKYLTLAALRELIKESDVLTIKADTHQIIEEEALDESLHLERESLMGGKGSAHKSFKISKMTSHGPSEFLRENIEPKQLLRQKEMLIKMKSHKIIKIPKKIKSPENRQRQKSQERFFDVATKAKQQIQKNKDTYSFEKEEKLDQKETSFKVEPKIPHERGTLESEDERQIETQNDKENEALIQNSNEIPPANSFENQDIQIEIKSFHSEPIEKMKANDRDDRIEKETILDVGDDVMDPFLVLRGHQTDRFYLVLSGVVDICSGNEGFHTELGSFNFIGASSLSNEEYIPDFSAKVMGEARLLRITRNQYAKHLKSDLNFPIKHEEIYSEENE